MKDSVLRRKKIRRVSDFILLLALAIVLSFMGFILLALGETDTPEETEIGVLDPVLVVEVWNASEDFAEEVTQMITITDEELGGKGSIDDLITLMSLSLKFTSKILEIVQNNATLMTEPEMDGTLNETSLITEERIEEAYLYLRLLQSDNPCQEAIDRMAMNGTWH